MSSSLRVGAANGLRNGGIFQVHYRLQTWFHLASALFSCFQSFGTCHEPLLTAMAGLLYVSAFVTNW